MKTPSPATHAERCRPERPATGSHDSRPHRPATHTATSARHVLALYSLSGFLSLGYQVIWFRLYDDRFGATNLTFALVVCSFIVGLALGALASHGFSAWLDRRLGLRDRLRRYGLIELLIGTTVLIGGLATRMPHTGDAFPYVLSGNVYQLTIGHQLWQIALSIVCILTPCFLMGLTFPLLCDAYRSISRFPSRLYAWNTLGACLGVIACQFVLLRFIGHGPSLWILAFANLLLGGYFVAIGGAPSPDIEPTESSEPLPQLRARGPAAPITALAASSGLMMGALEGDAFKRLAFLGADSTAAMSFVSFWAIVAIFLGSTIVHASKRLRLVHIRFATLAAVLAYCGAWSMGHSLLGALSERGIQAAVSAAPQLRYEPGWTISGFPTSLGQLCLVVGWFTVPGFFLLSLLFPYTCDRAHGRRHLGVIYGVNSLAFCMGMLAFTLIAPSISIFYSMKLSVGVLAIATGALFLISPHRPVGTWVPIASGAAVVLTALAIPRGFDAAYVTPGSPPALYPVRALRSNGAHTTYVVEAPDADIFYFDNHPMSATNAAAQSYMRLMAHFPLLAHAQPRKALLVCFGVGNTASAIAAHDSIEQIDVVDLNHQVFRTADEFSDTNSDVHMDPRVRLIHDDGRSFLARPNQRYDLITSEPPPPMQAGVYRLYSVEYYRSAAAHLAPGGLMSQWLPTYQMPEEAVRRAIASFLEVFPRALVFTGYRNEFVLVGGRQPIDVGRIESRFYAQERVIADLRSIRILEPVQLLARIVQGNDTLRQRYSGGGSISDQRNDLDHVYSDPPRRAVIAYDPEVTLGEVQAGRLASIAALRRTVMDLGLLLYRVPDFPPDSLMTTAEAVEQAPIGARVNWLEVQMLIRRYREALAADRPQDALRSLHRVVALSDRMPAVLNDLAWLLATSGDPSLRDARQSVRFGRKAAALTDFLDPGVLDTLAAAHANAGSFELAVETAELAASRAERLGLDSRRMRARLALYRAGLPYRE